MIGKVCALLFLLGSVACWGRGDFEKFGPLKLVLNSGYLKCIRDRSLELDVSLIDIYFYDFANNITENYPINNAAEAILGIKGLDKKKEFILFLGGFKTTINKRTAEQMREAYKNHPNSYLIIPDHSVYTNNRVGNRKGYERSVKYVYYIGDAIGKMMAGLTKGGVKSKNIHCIGHSLGGQMLGHTGETFIELTGEKISRITALDPAGPCFTKSFIQEQVRSGVADYVEVYHCNSGALGSSSILGDVDFIVNKRGETQPNCGTPYVPGFFDSSKAASCNHRVCIDVWTASVKNPGLFTAYRCDSYKNFKKERCSMNDKTVAGSGNSGKATGVYYLSTEQYDLEKIK